MKYKLVAMDLDGTLTQHKSKLEKTNEDILYRLKEKYRLVMLGAGGCRRIYDQMNQFPIDIVGNYGLQESTIVDGDFIVTRDDRYVVDRDFFETTIHEIRRITGYTDYVGDNVEFHQSGLVTFPLIGTKAKIEDKLSFDPDGKKRSAIYDLVVSRFPGYTCFIGGSSSFDIVEKQYNKYDALIKYVGPKGIDIHDVLFLGDDFKRGGNDEHIAKNAVDYIMIDNYRNLGKILSDRGII